MATTTEYLGLKKPDQVEFYNVDDFNENMDTIDAKMKEIEESGGNVTPESIGAVKADILTSIDANSTVANTIQHYCALGIMGGVFGATGCADLPSTDWHYGIKFYRSQCDDITVIAHKMYQSIFVRQYNAYSKVWKNEWHELATTDYVLPRDGSVPMSGADLWLNKGKRTKIADDNTGAILLYTQNADDSTNRRTLRLRNKEAIDNVSSALLLEDRINGADKTYKIFGEHNTDLLATAIQSLIEQGVINVSAVKSVQRGVYTHTSTNDASITINTVNSAKCVVILDSSITGGTSGGATGYIFPAKESTLVSLSNNKLTISSNYFTVNLGMNNGGEKTSFGTTSWQVIEYA